MLLDVIESTAAQGKEDMIFQQVGFRAGDGLAAGLLSFGRSSDYTYIVMLWARNRPTGICPNVALHNSSRLSNMSTSPLFLGLDLSTQQLKAILLSQHSTIVHEASVHFDRDLPHYGTINGAVRGPAFGEVTSPVQMWLEAIDLLFQRLKADKVDFSAIAAISGAGQVCHLSLSILAIVCLMCYSNMAQCTGQTKLLLVYPIWILPNL